MCGLFEVTTEEEEEETDFSSMCVFFFCGVALQPSVKAQCVSMPVVMV